MKTYSKIEVEFLKYVIAGKSYKEICKQFNEKFNEQITESQIKGFIGYRKLNTNRNGRFEKGCTAINKGIKSGGWKPTQFKQGAIPHNRLEIGSETITLDGYVKVKIQDGMKNGNWKFKHVLVWEQHYGALPKNHVIIFGDRNKRNFDIDNLICITRQQLSMLNVRGLIQNDADLTKTAILIVDLIQKIYKKTK